MGESNPLSSKFCYALLRNFKNLVTQRWERDLTADDYLKRAQDRLSVTRSDQVQREFQHENQVQEDANADDSWDKRPKNPIDLATRLDAVQDARMAFLLRPDAVSAKLYGRISRQLNDHTTAEVCFRTWVRKAPKSVDAQFALGQVLLERGNREEAITCFRDALTRSRRPGKIWFNLLSALPPSPNDAHELAAVDSLLDAGLGTYRDQTFLLFCRATLLERLGRLQESVTEYRLANGRKPRPDRHTMELFSSVHRLVDDLRSSDQSSQTKWSAGSDSIVTPVFIVGMPRSGTTLTERILVEQTGAFAAGELNDLGIITRQLTPGHTVSLYGLAAFLTARRERHLRSLIRLSQGSRLVIDKMPTNFLFLPMIEKLFPEAVIVHCRRDWRSVLWSAFTTNLAWPFCDLMACKDYFSCYESVMESFYSETNLRCIDVQYEEMVAFPDGYRERFKQEFGIGKALDDAKSDDEVHHTLKSTYVTRTPSKFAVHDDVHTRSLNRFERVLPFVPELQPDYY